MDIVVSEGAKFTETGLKLNKSMGYDEWENIVSQLARMEKATQWWIGDALNFGEAKYGEMYAQAIDDSQKKTWQNCKFVAKSIESSRRRELVSWSTHSEVAGLEPDAQNELLDMAEKAQLTKQQMRSEVKKYNRALLAAQANGGELPEGAEIVTGSFQQYMETLDDNSIDLIFTDPPYDEDSIPMYGELAELAQRKLKAGGSLIAYAGHYAMPKILPLMTPYLRFWWLLALKHGGGSARLIGKNVFVEWKPLLWFVKEKRWNSEYIADFFQSSAPTKTEHDWQQDTSEAEYYIEHLTAMGDLVVDPFCGSGTTILAAQKLGRRGLGIEIDKDNANVARHRLQTIA